MSAAHTPTPWRITVGTGAVEIRGGPARGVNNPRVARVLRSDNGHDDAVHILRCVNAHDELVAALQQIKRLGREGTTEGQIIREALTEIASIALAKAGAA